MTDHRLILEEALASPPSELDLTNVDDLERVRSLADDLLARAGDRLEALEGALTEQRDAVPLAWHLAVKLARSKVVVRELGQPFHVSVVFAVYKEQDRIRTPDEHPHGEDFLRRKVSQLRWLFDDVPGAEWDLTLVDDGCPEGSGHIAREILADLDVSDRVSVLFLEDAIREQLPVARPMASTSESQKGGSIEYGMWAAVQQERENHVVLFTDADLSTHLGQSGLLLGGILRDGFSVAIGSRREPRSVVVKQGKRNTRGKLFIYLWKRMLPILGQVVDTQCGFKAFRADLVREIVADTIEKKFAFDIELLLKTELRRGGSIVKVPIAWIDSEAASTTTDLEPYLSMLRAVATCYRRYMPRADEPEAFATFIESLDEASWQRLVDAIPREIAEGEPAEFGEYNGVAVDDLRASISR